MKLTKLKIEDFKRVESVELALSDVNILVGENGSGKSSIIQAIHLACCMIRQADRVVGGATSTVGIDELDYLPSNNYKSLAHKAEWGNKVGTPSSKATFTFAREGNEYTANCELRSARNAGISITGTIPNELTDTLRKSLKFFSGYIPGISGIPNREEKRSRKVILKACSYGDSNIILRNVLLLLSELDSRNISLIEGWISSIVGPIRIEVIHREDRDLSIKCNVTTDDDTRPLELIGTRLFATDSNLLICSAFYTWNSSYRRAGYSSTSISPREIGESALNSSAREKSAYSDDNPFTVYSPWSAV